MEQIGRGGPVTFTHVPAEFLDANDADLPIWVPRAGTPFSGYGSVSNAKAIAAGLDLPSTAASNRIGPVACRPGS